MGNVGRAAGRTDWSGALLLFGLKRRWPDAALTAAAAGLLLWSRLALLPSGPWEWDETLFANGIFYFSLAAHYPQPPGFPLWIWIGHLFWKLAPTPLGALQLASSLLSVLALWPLAALGRKIAPPPAAAAAALCVLLLPGPWLHAVRGFSSTPAATFALLAAALLAGGLDGWRATAFSVCVAAAFLIRPILLPGLGLLWLGGVWTVRPVRRLAPGTVIGLAGILGSMAWMVHREGGPGPFLHAFAVHAATHAHNLARNAGGLLELGLVRGVGGPVWAAALALLGAGGLLVWARRRSRAGATLYAGVLAVTILQLVFLQNRTYTRYAVPVQLAAAPLVAGAVAALLPPAGAVAGLGAAALAAGIGSYPLLVEQHAAKLPGWAAVEAGMQTARREGEDVIAEAGLYPFADFLSHVMGGGAPAARPRLALSPWSPETFAGVGRSYLVVTDHPGWYLGSLTGRIWRRRGVSRRLEPFTQGRFLDAAVIEKPPLPVGRWWLPERGPGGGRFMWGSAGAGLILPPLPAGTWIRLEAAPARGDAPLEVRCNGGVVAEIGGGSGRFVRWIAPAALRSVRPNRIVFARGAVYPPGHGDSRPLAVQLFAITTVGPGVPWRGPVATPAERRRLRIGLEGGYPAETFPGIGRGCWLRPRAVLTLPAGAGDVLLRVVAPRPTDPGLAISSGGRVLGRFSGLGPGPSIVHLRLQDGDVRGGEVRLELACRPYNPAAAGAGRDRRDLGIVLLDVDFRPARGSRAGLTGPGAGPRMGVPHHAAVPAGGES